MDHNRLLTTDPLKVKCYADIEGKSLYGQRNAIGDALRFVGIDGPLDQLSIGSDKKLSENIVQVSNALDSFYNFRPLAFRKPNPICTPLKIKKRLVDCVECFIGAKLVRAGKHGQFKLTLSEKILAFSNRSVFFEN
jgi:hypothetical protein